MKQVLIVDDDVISNEFMSLFLKDRGLIVRSALSYQEGLKMLSAAPLDILITDVDLPDGSGIELARLARVQGISRILCISGYAKEQLLEGGHDISAYDRLLTKPIDFDELEKALS